MKNFSIPKMFLVSLLVASSFTPFAPAESKPLTWADLVNHPERWPAGVKLTEELKFNSGTLKAGTVVGINKVTAKEAELVAPQGFVFGASPTDSDLLQAANAQWSALTPAQQLLTLHAIEQDRSLWPSQVTIVVPLDYGPLHLPAGTVLPLVKLHGGDVSVFYPKTQRLLATSASNTDLFLRSRQLVALPLDQRPGQMADLLVGTTIDANGKPVTTQPTPRYFVVYFASYTCPRCKVFTPKLVEHFNTSLADRKDVAFVTLSQDQSTPLMLDYVRQNAIPWPTIPSEKNDLLMAKEGSVMSVQGILNFPGILVLDRFGNPLLATSKLPGQPLDAANTALAQLDTVIK